MNADSAKVPEQWIKAVKLHDYLIESQQGAYKPTERNVLFHGLCDLALEHHGAMLTLLRTQQHIGSALALFRPLLETCVRALWVLHCCKEQRLKLLLKWQKNFPPFETCRQAVHEHYRVAHHALLFDIAPEYMEYAHGLTHSGVEQIQYRFDDHLNMRPSYPPELVCRVIQQSSMWLTMATIERVQLVEGSASIVSSNAVRLADYYRSLFPELV